MTNYSASFVSAPAAKTFETTALPLDYSALKYGYRLLRWTADFKHIELVPQSEIGLYMMDSETAPMPAFVDFGLIAGWEACAEPTELIEVHAVKSLSSAWTSFVEGQYYSFTQGYVLFRNPEEEREGSRVTTRWGYTFPRYDGTLTLNGTNIAVRPDHQVMGLFPIKGHKIGLDPIAFQLGAQMVPDTTEAKDMEARLGATDPRTLNAWKKYNHACNAFWKYSLGRALLTGGCIRAKVGKLTWFYVKAMINMANQFEGKPVEARRQMFEQLKANDQAKVEYKERKAAGNPIPTVDTGMVFAKWGTETENYTLAELRAIPSGTKVMIMASRTGTGRMYPIYWPATTADQDAFLAMCKGAYAIKF